MAEVVGSLIGSVLIIFATCAVLEGIGQGVSEILSGL